MTTQQDQVQLCRIAEDFLSHIAKLETTLAVMQASYNQTIDQSNLSNREKTVLKHITSKVSPAGLHSLLEAIRLTADSTKLLYIKEYSQAAASLSSTIYQQSGIAGPTGERTFTNKSDGDRARVKEVCHPVKAEPKIPEPVIIPRNKSAEMQLPQGTCTTSVTRYLHYLKRCSLLHNLTKAAKEPPSVVHQWVQICGYEMENSAKAQASLEKGLNALLWPANNNEVNAVQKVHMLPHPSKQGNVFILTMEQPTNGSESNHLPLQIGTTWSPKAYPMCLVIEVSPKASKECPFTKSRRGWEEINQYLEREHESTGTINSPGNSTNPKYNLKTI